MIEKEALVKLVSKGFSVRAIAKELGVCPATACKALHKYSLQTQYQPLFIEQAVLEQMIADGLSTWAIAKKLDRSQFCVCWYLKKYRLKTKHKRKVRQDCCSYCGEEDKKAFYSDRFCMCKVCQKKYTQDRNQRLKQEFVDYKGGKCELCGYNKCLASLHFHHVDPKTKDPKWRSLLKKTLEQVKEELDKCQLLCANCHGEVHYSQGQKYEGN